MLQNPFTAEQNMYDAQGESFSREFPRIAGNLFLHLEFQGAASGDLLVSEGEAVEGLAVEFHTFHVDAVGGLVGRENCEVFTASKVQGGFLKEGRAQDVLGGTGMEGVKAECGEDIPS